MCLRARYAVAGTELAYWGTAGVCKGTHDYFGRLRYLPTRRLWSGTDVGEILYGGSERQYHGSKGGSEMLYGGSERGSEAWYGGRGQVGDGSRRGVDALHPEV
eukprot:3933939-Rhodomonas_salina.1